MKRFVLIGTLVAILLIEPLLAALRIEERLEDPTVPSPTEFALQFLGEIRYTLAAYLWLKVELYHHELGLNYVTSRVGGEDLKKVGEILSICRLVTRLDPQFDKAYDVGSWRLARGAGKVQEAIRFVQEGLSKNPNNGLLNDDMAQLYFFFLKDCAHAIPYLERASRLNTDKIATANDLRILGRCYELRNETQLALNSYRRLLQVLPEDPYTKIRIKAIEKKLGVEK